MSKMTTEEIIRNINNEIIFEATLEDGSFTLILEKYVPFICTAIHNGSNLDRELKDKCLLTHKERWYEEDPYTGEFIASLPIRLIANDSRYFYDLNRDEDKCLYDMAWGKKVWSHELANEEVQLAIGKHKVFYEVLKALTHKIESKYGVCIIYDIHSYNYMRNNLQEESPIFNLGTAQIDKKRYGRYIKRFLRELKAIKFDLYQNTVEADKVFYGKGYLAQFIKATFKDTLVLPLEIKKVYCNEKNGDVYPDVVACIKEGLKKAITEHSMYFINKESNRNIGNSSVLLSPINDKNLLEVDKKLYALLRNFETLTYVNPKNLERCRKSFYDSKYRKIPGFQYTPMKIDVYALKKTLYTLPVSDIEDISIQRMYMELINDQVTTIDMLSSRGSDEFLYNSLRLYGRPTYKDVRNAYYLIQSSGLIREEERNLSTEEVLDYFKKELLNWGLGGTIALGKNMAARIMVNSTKKAIIVNDKTQFNRVDLKLLSQHEIGVHMLTTMNALNQPLKCLSLGLPGNAKTQEGLAVLSEVLTGNIPIERLKNLAYRVIAVDYMVKGYSFKDIFEIFIEEYGFNRDDAFNLAARVKRGGGFSKDYVYLTGFLGIYERYLKGEDFSTLLIGKTSIDYLDLLKELIQRNLLVEAKYKNSIFETSTINNPIIEYLLNSILMQGKLKENEE